MAKVSIDDKREEESIIDGKISFNPKQLEKWKAVYGIVGHHSDVEICSWTKKALTDKGTCYKNKFYGVDTHRCTQMSPAAAWCQQACIFCWRPHEWYSRISMKKEEVDSPEYIIEESNKVRKKLITGFGGNPEVNKTLFDEAYNLFPSHWAISLSGEPTIYPLLPDMIKELRKHKEVRSIFIVSNGQEPEVFKKMAEEDALPTQLYISVDACDESMFKYVNRSIYGDGWKRLLKTLHEILPHLRTRRVIRYTLIKGVNDAEHGKNKECMKRYAEIFENSKADYIEVKAYMFLGQSRERLSQENMPRHPEIVEWSKKLLEYLPNYKWHNEHAPSRIVLLKRKDSIYDDYIKGARAEESIKDHQ